jgi:hypothetical protein
MKKPKLPVTSCKHPPMKSAFFVTTEQAAHAVDIHILMTDHSPLHVAMFNEIPAAAKWLGVTVEDLQIGEKPACPQQRGP